MPALRLRIDPLVDSPVVYLLGYLRNSSTVSNMPSENKPCNLSNMFLLVARSVLVVKQSSSMFLQVDYSSDVTGEPGCPLTYESSELVLAMVDLNLVVSSLCLLVIAGLKK